jgi:hypothetical protein
MMPDDAKSILIFELCRFKVEAENYGLVEIMAIFYQTKSASSPRQRRADFSDSFYGWYAER